MQNRIVLLVLLLSSTFFSHTAGVISTIRMVGNWPQLKSYTCAQHTCFVYEPLTLTIEYNKICGSREVLIAPYYNKNGQFTSTMTIEGPTALGQSCCPKNIVIMHKGVIVESQKVSNCHDLLISVGFDNHKVKLKVD